MFGRIVLKRGPFDVRKTNSTQDASQNLPKAGKKGVKGKKKGNSKEDILFKTEYHLLGGSGPDEVLYLEAWGDMATQVDKLMQVGKVYCIAGGKIMAQAPKYSTSRLTYYIRLQGPLGKGVQIEECTSEDYADLPIHHPITPIDKLHKIATTMRVCLSGIILQQPGLVARDTKFGPANVCNAILKQGTHQIRCAFWRDIASVLASKNVGDAIMLTQVTVLKVKLDSWEAHATESTTVQPCPDDMKERLNHTTDVNTGGVSLTTTTSIDYDTKQALPYTLSALAACIVPQESRDLSGIYEVHNVAIMGVTAVLKDDTFVMKSCVKCKKALKDDRDHCDEHFEAGSEMRWIMSFAMADETGAIEAMAYQDALADLDFLGASTPDSKAVQKIVRSFRAVPWSVRFVFKQNEYKNVNSLEIKRLSPTFTKEGIISTCTFKPAPQVPATGACPCAYCVDVSYDADLGVARVREKDAAAVRVLLRIHEAEEDEDTAVPDLSRVGLRVTRKVQCALSDNNKTFFNLEASGVASSVQWLIRANGGSIFFITAKVRERDGEIYFFALSSWDVSQADTARYISHMRKVVGDSANVEIDLSPRRATPHKRQESFKAKVPSSSAEGEEHFSKRQHL